jgi:hypothetical protein
MGPLVLPQDTEKGVEVREVLGGWLQPIGHWLVVRLICK